ncbi:hypothetical protein CHA01nite_39620 [Chryseobacterium hagamense]|uniref:Lantibiotic dehydratase N-terminal domain-containing protein n=1 Tax=Chryseobacterium hagamense TaxID=395935 RepID=A0A511YSR9_9FLAO|nr:hypothetical protein CHA01nite_39620 [Chryseobacterium hagamense]
MNKFKKAFSERFNEEEVSLLYALDTEIGIGYRQDLMAKGIHSYLDDFKFSPLNKPLEFQIKINSVQYLLNRKLQNAQLENTTVIKLIEEDLNGYVENWENLPDTISFMSEIVLENEKEKLIIQGGKRSSAANLLARFCSEKSEIQKIAKKITEKELELNSDYILAEILHLPEARIGNIIRRPTLRSYEIPYLAQSVLPNENQIQADDLYISLKNDRIILRSRKLNKEIKPYLTNAHNYASNSLPVYHFLCDLYSQNIRSGLQFDWGDLKHLYIFFPRIEYENIIFSKAQWKIDSNEIPQVNDREKFLIQFKNWRKKRRIPQWIQWTRNDHALTLNLKNYDMIDMFIQITKKEKSIIVEEFLHNENDDFKREFIFLLYKVK